MSLPQLVQYLNGGMDGLLPVQTSAGESSSGSVVALNASGQIDSSMLPAAATDIQFAVGSASTLTANAYLAGYIAVSTVTFPANFSGSSMVALKAATDAQTINFIHVPSGSTTGTTVGTATFAAGGKTANLATTSGAAITLSAGDSMLAQVSSTADATLATIIGTIVGSL